MRFVMDTEAFKQYQARIDGLIRREKRLPENVFKGSLTHFVFIHADDLFHTQDPFGKMKSFVTSISEERWFLAVVEPDPEDYFFRHFGKYSIIEMSVNDTTDEYRRILLEDPGDSPADAIMINSTIMMLASDSGRWAIYVDQGMELAIAGFVERELRENFTAAYHPDGMLDVDEAIERVLEPLYEQEKVPEDIRRQLTSNYGAAKN